ncbi:pyridoxamine 5'-phosphate oxidase [Deinococcus humi]|nr:pyridoxamine 5'-phosphate oxidase [Deinococcus humi]
MTNSSDTYVITSLTALEQLYPTPSTGVTLKVMDHLDEALQSALALSTLCFLATSNTEGHLDCSPRGDPAGAVQVLGAKTLMLADRPGNNRLDSLRNIIQNPEVGLIFLLPGVNEVVRVNGRASISVEPALLSRAALGGKLPRTVLIIQVREAFMHCPRAFSKAELWDPRQHLTDEQRPDFNAMYAAHVLANTP